LTIHLIKLKQKTLWLMGEMGYKHTNQIEPFVPKIAVMLYDGNEKLRERAVGALGRIGRGNIFLILPYINKMLCMANDSVPAVRMNFIWASENIATNNPDIFKNHMSIFANLLNDCSIRVRMEAPEIFRVIGKRKPEYVKPYIVKLGLMAQNDPDRVVRIHSSGAIRATMEKQTVN